MFTYGSELGLLQQSCDRVGIILQTFDKKWTDYVDIKVRSALEFLATRSEDYVMWVDGNDSLVLKPEEEILARFKLLDVGVLLAAEANCWPDAEEAKRYREVPPGMPRFLNAGGWIGRRQDVVTALNLVLREAVGGDDQRAWTKAFLAGCLPDCGIDHGRWIFSSEGDGEATKNADPCVRHFNGRTPGRWEFWEQLAKGDGNAKA